jgi:addiction module RelE/StbE family toxin
VRVEWAAPAFEDRRVIFEFIEADNPAAAVSIDNRISEQIAHLVNFPQMGRPGRVRGTRELVITHTPYIAAYRVDSETLTVLRILHGAQQWPDNFAQL